MGRGGVPWPKVNRWDEEPLMLRYSSVLRSNALQHREISYNQLTPKPDANNPDALKPKKLDN